MASQEIEALSQALARLPGLGPRSARRAVLYLMKKREAALQPLLTALRNVADKLSTCSICGNVDTSDRKSPLHAARGNSVLSADELRIDGIARRGEQVVDQRAAE